MTTHEDIGPFVLVLHCSEGPREKLHHYMDAIRGLSDAEQRTKLTQAARIVLIDELVRQEMSSSTIRQVVKRARQQCKLMGLPKDEASRILNAVNKAVMYYWAAGAFDARSNWFSL